MGSKRHSQSIDVDSLIGLLTRQLAEKDRQLAAAASQMAKLQEQLGMVLEDKYYKPEIPPAARPEAPPAPLYDGQDVSVFDGEADGADLDEALDGEFLALAREHAQGKGLA
jgi:hypothetical protein